MCVILHYLLAQRVTFQYAMVLQETQHKFALATELVLLAIHARVQQTIQAALATFQFVTVLVLQILVYAVEQVSATARTIALVILAILVQGVSNLIALEFLPKIHLFVQDMGSAFNRISVPVVQTGVIHNALLLFVLV